MQSRDSGSTFSQRFWRCLNIWQQTLWPHEGCRNPLWTLSLCKSIWPICSTVSSKYKVTLTFGVMFLFSLFIYVFWSLANLRKISNSLASDVHQLFVHFQFVWQTQWIFSKLITVSNLFHIQLVKSSIIMKHWLARWPHLLNYLSVIEDRSRTHTHTLTNLST